MNCFELPDSFLQIFNVDELLIVLLNQLLNFDQEGGYLVIEFENFLLELRAIDSLNLTGLKSRFLEFFMQSLHLFVLLEKIILQKSAFSFTFLKPISQSFNLLFTIIE